MSDTVNCGKCGNDCAKPDYDNSSIIEYPNTDKEKYVCGNCK